MKLGKDAADDRVEASLYHPALGYSHEAVKMFMRGDEPVIGLELIVVDYIQLMAGSGKKGDNRVQDVTEITSPTASIIRPTPRPP